MFSRKAVTKTAQEGQISKDVSLSRSDKILARLLSSTMAFAPAGLGTLTTYDSIMAHLATNPSYVMAGLGGMTIAGSMGGLYINKVLNSESMSNQIAKVIDLDKKFTTTAHVNQKMKELKRSKGERILLKSFYVKETSELDITSWKSGGNSYDSQSTHTIYQSLVKTKNGYLIEQRIVPNNEAIWDMSADALVEVYGIKEKTESTREVTA